MLTKQDLDQFTGSEQFFRHSLVRSVVYTEGVQYMAEQANAYWLIDVVASWQLDPKAKAEEFQVWKLRVNPDKSARVAMEDGNDHEVLHQDIEYTDFPLPEFVLWFANGTILLPSEY